jgi:hypothetical protein
MNVIPVGGEVVDLGLRVGDLDWEEDVLLGDVSDLGERVDGAVGAGGEGFAGLVGDVVAAFSSGRDEWISCGAVAGVVAP